jgi:hypothetical protein
MTTLALFLLNPLISFFSFVHNHQSCWECVSGFHQVALRLGLNGLQPQGLKEYSDSYLASDYLGPILGSKCLVTRTTGNYLRLRSSEEPQRGCFRLPPGLSIFHIIFLLCILIGLTSLATVEPVITHTPWWMAQAWVITGYGFVEVC